MVMISLLLDNEVFKILTLFGISPGSRFNRSEIKEKTRLNNIPLDNALKSLRASGLLERERNFYSLTLIDEKPRVLASIVSSQYKSMKSLPLDVYFLITDFMKVASKVKGIEVYLFGSYSKLVYSEKSDVDMAVLTVKTGKESVKAINAAARKLESKYNKKIELHFFNKWDFHKNLKDPLVKDIVRNGLKVLG